MYVVAKKRIFREVSLILVHCDTKLLTSICSINTEQTTCKYIKKNVTNTKKHIHTHSKYNIDYIQTQKYTQIIYTCNT